MVWPRADALKSEGEIGFVFQEPTLMPWTTVAGNVRLPLDLQRVDAAAAAPRVMAALARVGLTDFADVYPRELSGGMKMRVSIARALVTGNACCCSWMSRSPRSMRSQGSSSTTICSHCGESLRKTIVFVTHSVFESVSLSSRIVVMTPRPGRVCAELAIDAPHPRDQRFRTSRQYGAFCRRASDALAAATAAKARSKIMSEEPIRAQGLGEDALRLALPVILLRLGALRLSLGACRAPQGHSGLCAAGASLVFATLVSDWPILSEIAGGDAHHHARRIVIALISEWVLSLMFNLSRLVEYSLYPYAVILQVTPVVAIAPLLLIYLPQQAAVLACAWIVAFFPVLANTTLGLNSVDHNLVDLFRLYGASQTQVLWRLKLPSALPYILGGLKIAGGLSLIGAVVAEIAAGAAGAGLGLAYRISELGLSPQHPAHVRGAGAAVGRRHSSSTSRCHFCRTLLLRRWHESAVSREA